MRNDDMPSVDELFDDWVLPDSEEEWLEWWWMNTYPTRARMYPVRTFPHLLDVEAEAA